MLKYHLKIKISPGFVLHTVHNNYMKEEIFFSLPSCCLYKLHGGRGNMHIMEKKYTSMGICKKNLIKFNQEVSELVLFS